MIRSRPTLPGDRWLFTDLREAEMAEGEAIGETSAECMRVGLLYSDAQTIFFNDVPAAMWGICHFPDFNLVWAIFTKEIERHPIAFLRESRRLKDAFTCDVENYVDARNVAAVKWFKWLGFEVSEPVPYGRRGELFHRFTHVCSAERARAELEERAWAS